jgi:hypothetical protein
LIHVEADDAQSRRLRRLTRRDDRITHSFSIGVSGVEDAIRYIQTQEEHPRQRSFREELEISLKKHGYDYQAEMAD